MLTGLDDVDWEALPSAYGPPVPQQLRDAASGDARTAGRAISKLYDTIFHQGTVYPASVAAVPFLAELAVAAPHDRAEFAWLLGSLAEDQMTHAAVAAQLPLLTPLLAHELPGVREAAAFATARAGVSAPPLRERWAV